MYLPKHFEEVEQSRLLEVMRSYNFATLVSCVEGVPFATHLPVLVREEPQGLVIDAHVAAANPHWRAFATESRALVIFHGPHTYVSPTSYRSTRRVPTWNYIVVHATGKVRIVPDAAEKLAIIGRLIDFHDPEFAPRFADFEVELRNSLLAAIVGLEIQVERLEGKFKLNQHRLTDDRPELLREYEAGDENHRAIANWMKRLGHWQ